MRDSSPSIITYIGFENRMLASVIDSVFCLIILYPVFSILFSPDPSLSELSESMLRGLISPEEYWQKFSDYMIFEGGIEKASYDFLLQLFITGVVIVAFWIYRSATPGKMIFKMKIVDAKSLSKPSNIQMIIRWLAYFVSAIPLMLGFFWIIFDKKKQGFHDKIAGTVVISTRKNKCAI